MKKNFKYIYGPVFSWRLGRSLGVDPISFGTKLCSFNCVYCQLGDKVRYLDKRKIFIPTKYILKEILETKDTKVDYVTFSGMGEPTLAKNLGEIARGVKKLKKCKLAILTNSSLLYRKDVREDLYEMDFVGAKLDAFSESSLKEINEPLSSISLKKTVEGIKKFKKKFNGKLALQIMFTKDNAKYAAKIASLAKKIRPDEIEINTPLRVCNRKPLGSNEIRKIKNIFIRIIGIKSPVHLMSVYDKKTKTIRPISSHATLARHGEVI